MNTQLLEEAKHLSPGDQMELIAALWSSLTEHSSLALPTEAQKVELDRRLAEHLKDPDDVVPWEQVKASVRNHIGQ